MQKEVYDILAKKLDWTDEYHPRNFNFFPGSDPNVTAEQIAEAIANAIKAVVAGDYEEVDLSI